MKIVNIHQAKTQLSRLLELAAGGEDIVIAKAGKPIARLIPYAPRQEVRRPGLWSGQVKLAPDFEELPAAMTDAFKGEAP